jgi:hypothetical protein
MIELSQDTVLETLEHAECRRLLETTNVGRVGLVVAELAYVLPVNYAVAADLVVFRTAKGSTFDRLARDRPLTFEIDHVDPGFHAGWSVMAIGWGFGLEDQLPAEVLQALHLRPWGMGAEPGWIGVRIDELTGRRVLSLPRPPGRGGTR